jgi:hypothetical protein
MTNASNDKVAAANGKKTSLGDVQVGITLINY